MTKVKLTDKGRVVLVKISPAPNLGQPFIPVDLTMLQSVLIVQLPVVMGDADLLTLTWQWDGTTLAIH